MLRLIYQILGWFFLGAGIVLFPLPIPLGIPFIAIGFSLLLANSTHFTAFLQGVRKKFPKFNASLTKMTSKMPGPIQKQLSKTDPNHIPE